MKTLSNGRARGRMARLATILGLGLIVASPAALAKEVSGVDVPEQITVDNQKTLKLQGAGVREKFFIDLYVGSLYVANKQKDVSNIVAADEPMALSIDVISDMITSERMTEATREGFEKSTKGETAKLQKEINSLLETFSNKISKGDNFKMVYVPGEGVKIYKNAKLEKTIAGLDFKKALFGIWLSEQPAQKSLKRDMLGG